MINSWNYFRFWSARMMMRGALRIVPQGSVRNELREILTIWGIRATVAVIAARHKNTLGVWGDDE